MAIFSQALCWIAVKSYQSLYNMVQWSKVEESYISLFDKRMYSIGIRATIHVKFSRWFSPIDTFTQRVPMCYNKLSANNFDTWDLLSPFIETINTTIVQDNIKTENVSKMTTLCKHKILTINWQTLILLIRFYHSKDIFFFFKYYR